LVNLAAVEDRGAHLILLLIQSVGDCDGRSVNWHRRDQEGYRCNDFSHEPYPSSFYDNDPFAHRVQLAVAVFGAEPAACNPVSLVNACLPGKLNSLQ
jgi:hypothetical protein